MTKPTNPIDKGTLVRMRAALVVLPPKEKTTFTHREAVAELAAEILQAREELDYSVEDIAKMLCEHGIEIKPGTLRGYLRDLAKSVPAKKIRRRSKAGAGMAATPSAQADNAIDRELAVADVATSASGCDG